MDETERGGQVTATSLKRQLDVLNEAFSPHNITFKTAEAYTIVAPDWADNCQELEMKKVLQNGTYADLNVYIFPYIGCIDFEPLWGILGSAKFPSNVKPGSIEYKVDAVHIRASTMPGGTLAPNNEGMTLVHEVGHWLGCECQPSQAEFARKC
jgi:hypothetical protein